MLRRGTNYTIHHVKCRAGTLTADVMRVLWNEFGGRDDVSARMVERVIRNTFAHDLSRASRRVKDLLGRGAIMPSAVGSAPAAAEKPTTFEGIEKALKALDAADKTPEPAAEGKPIAETIADLLGADFNVLLTGPTGCGKTTVAMAAAERLGVDCYVVPCSAGMSEHHLLGRLMPTEADGWKFTPAPFSRAWAEGGLVILDEIDAADANVLLVLNSALANGRLVDGEGKTIMRHEHCYIMATANTAGGGATETYAGRSHLDASTVDRFSGAILEMDYCPIYEGANVDKAVLRFVGAVRRYIEAESLPYACSTRFALAATKRKAIGHNGRDIEASYFATWHKDDVEGLRATGSPRIV